MQCSGLCETLGIGRVGVAIGVSGLRSPTFIDPFPSENGLVTK